jgi:2-polyprenyl-3-methyl-5-hydroxy-6-metoxy-1,4-benzoquinol methylase
LKEDFMATAPTLFTTLQQRLSYRTRERWFRRVVERRKAERLQGFFDANSGFLTSSHTAATANRLNERHRAMIESNRDIISGCRVLDLASHDGRWSFAAAQSGASYVLGIEARPHLVAAAREHLSHRPISHRLEFRTGDVMSELPQLTEAFDTVFCFGFLYHMIDHMALFRAIRRLNPRHLVIDTEISTQPGAIIEVWEEAIDVESAAAFADAGSPGLALKGWPTKSALEMMLNGAGFGEIRYWDWKKAGVKCWADLKDYYLGQRVTIRCVTKN